jgi:hypothetical protein
MIEPGGLAGKGASKPGFAGASLPGDDQILPRLQPGALR